MTRTLAQLDAAVAALEAAATPDSIAPSLLTIGPSGQVGADFTGHVHAQGLDLDVGTTTTPPDVDRVRWLRASDGAARASLYAVDIPAGDLPAHVSMDIEVAGHTQKLLDSNGLSGFPQLAGAAANRVLDFGSAVLTWAGGSPLSTILAVAHNLNVAPTGVLLGAGAIGFVPVDPGWGTGTPTQFSLIARSGDGTNPPANTHATVSWLAFL